MIVETRTTEGNGNDANGCKLRDRIILCHIHTVGYMTCAPQAFVCSRSSDMGSIDVFCNHDGPSS